MFRLDTGLFTSNKVDLRGGLLRTNGRRAGWILFHPVPPVPAGKRARDISQAYNLSSAEGTGAALLDNNKATAKSTSQDGGMAVNFG